MPKISLIFSESFRDSFVNKTKTASFLKGDVKIGLGEKVIVLISDKEDLQSCLFETKIIVEVTKETTKKIHQITKEDAIKCGYADEKEVIFNLEKYYQSNDSSNVTLLEFKY